MLHIFKTWFGAFTAILLILLLDVPTAFSSDPIVYSRCERTTDSHTVTADVKFSGVSRSITKTFTKVDVYDALPDVTNFFRDFSAPCDLVYRDGVGEETVIYNCSATSTMESSCAALDPTVSFDGKTIAFSVFKGPLYFASVNLNGKVLHPSADSLSVGRITFPNKRLNSEGSHIHFYNLDTGLTTVIPYEVGVFDSGPTFTSSKRISFTSNRDGNASTKVGTSYRPGTRIWAMDIDGTNLDLSSHHGLSMEQHPHILKNGRIAYSSWQIFGGLPYRHSNGSPGGFTTVDNLFHIYGQTPEGSDNFPIYGQHSGGHSASSSINDNHNASHFIAQTGDERIWFADYYRGNNRGLGILVGVIQEPPGQEGISPEEATVKGDIFMVRDAKRASTWAHNNDNTSDTLLTNRVVNPNYSDPIPFAGKLGHPGALPNNGLMVSWGYGPCSDVYKGTQIFQTLGLPTPVFADGNGSGVALSFMEQLGLDIPACDVGIYKTTVIPSIHPSDLELIVDSPDWYEIMARAVVPYSDIHGVDAPEEIKPSRELVAHRDLINGTPFGLLGSSSMIDRETHPRDGIKFQGILQFNLQGTDTINYSDDDICGVRILGIMPNRYVRPGSNIIHDLQNLSGERVLILGEEPVKNKDANGVRIIDPNGDPDTSFLVRMPANIPYMMQAVDCDGRTLNTDQTWQHLRPGEKKTCNGCHVHSRPGHSEFKDTFAASSEYVIPKLGEGTVKLMTGLVDGEVTTRQVPGYGMQVDFTRDILPIFERRCASCHSEINPAAGLVLTRPGTNISSTWHCLTSDRGQTCVAPENRYVTGLGHSGTFLNRPQVSRYIRALNSRGSLLYWKAANKRTDNLTDADRDDIDFGADHPTDITPDELGLISRWIDTGSPGGSAELLDTQKPTLTLVAVTRGDAIIGFRVGTADLGSGIDANSLMVCVESQGSGCVNIASQAEPHGITTIPLDSELLDTNAVIRASVSDMTGNVTKLTRTFDWYVNADNVNTRPRR